jgi:phosphatidate cytidylyltransferase
VVTPSSFWIAILEDYGMVWVIYAAALVMINDTMAYVFGMTFGKHALLPQISPKKTWEGFLGAAASTVLASLYMIPPNDGATGMAKLQDALVLSMYASVIGPFGGFLASVIKRAYGKKDFGTLIPGHGGLVDRFDCQLIMAPFVYLYLQHTRQPTPT